MTVTAKANLILLNRMTEVFFEGENVFAAFSCKTVAEAAGVLVAHGSDRVTVRFRTDDRHAEDDTRVYSRRLAKLAAAAGYEAGEFTLPVVNGYPQNGVRVATMTRNR